MDGNLSLETAGRPLIQQGMQKHIVQSYCDCNNLLQIAIILGVEF